MSYLLATIQGLRGMTTVNQLFAITHIIYESLDSGKDVYANFLDVSKVFDQV